MQILLLVVCAVQCAVCYGTYDFNMTPYCTPKEKCYPSKKQFETLGDTLNGSVIFRNEKEHSEQSVMHNINEDRTPNVIVMVRSEDDVRAALLFAREYNLHVTIRSSGHSYVGRSTADDSFMINLSEMDEFEIKLKDKRHKDGVLTTQTGVTWGELYVALDKVGRIAVGGACPTVTPGGYTLGGGHSVVSPSHGYAVDNLLEARVVLVDGRYATCTERKTIIEHMDGQTEVLNDGDLFWALKGGGGGTYGVVVRLVFKIHRAPESLVLFYASLPLESDVFPGGDLKSEAFDVLSDMLPTLPQEWGGYWYVDNFQSEQALPYAYRGILAMSYVKLAPWDGTEQALFSDILTLTATYNMVGGLVNMTSILQFYLPFGESLASHVNIQMMGIMLPPENTGVTMIEWLNASLFYQQAEIHCSGVTLGGETMNVRTDTPLHPGYRRAVSYLLCLLHFRDGDDEEALVQLADSLAESLKTIGDGEYFNEPSKNNPTWKEDYWGLANYQRLMGIKYRYDPTNFLTCHHCVASDVTP